LNPLLIFCLQFCQFFSFLHLDMLLGAHQFYFFCFFVSCPSFYCAKKKKKKKRVKISYIVSEDKLKREQRVHDDYYFSHISVFFFLFFDKDLFHWEYHLFHFFLFSRHRKAFLVDIRTDGHPYEILIKK
jgi:hypothetical protein